MSDVETRKEEPPLAPEETIQSVANPPQEPQKVFLKIGETVLEQNTEALVVLNSGVTYSGKIQAYGTYLSLSTKSRLVMIKVENLSHLEIVMAEDMRINNVDLPKK